MINLDIKLSDNDIFILSMIDFCEEDYLHYGSYSLAVECKGFDVEENYMDAIAEGSKEANDELVNFKTMMQDLSWQKLVLAEKIYSTLIKKKYKSYLKTMN